MNRSEYDLDVLQAAARRIVDLLEDRHPGVGMWNTKLKGAIEAVEAVTRAEPAGTGDEGPKP